MLEDSHVTLDEFFSGREESRRIFDVLHDAIDALGPVQIRVTKSQVAFRRTKAFAWAWVPDRYLRQGHAPLVLTLSFARRDKSPRWKEIVELAPGRFTHHLELRSELDIDGEVRCWLREAWEVAGEEGTDSQDETACFPRSTCGKLMATQAAAPLLTLWACAHQRKERAA